MKTSALSRFLYAAGVLLLGILPAILPSAALAYDSGPARRMDFLGIHLASMN